MDSGAAAPCGGEPDFGKAFAILTIVKVGKLGGSKPMKVRESFVSRVRAFSAGTK